MLHSYQTGNLDYSLAFHCAPALAGLKTANLISLSKARYQNFMERIARRQRRLQQGGIRMALLAETPRRVLLLIYHQRLLVEHLGRPDVQKVLGKCGYPVGDVGDGSSMIARLGGRLRESGGEYPHEIGIFLGYPLPDVLGFIRHRGESCKLCGYWKVYGDLECAKRLFATYDTVRQFYCRRVLCGDQIHTIHYGGCER